MANNAHFITAKGDAKPRVVVRDDRGAAITELELPESVTKPDEVDEELRAAGWSRSSSVQWTEADDGWVAPVVPS